MDKKDKEPSIRTPFYEHHLELAKQDTRTERRDKRGIETITLLLGTRKLAAATSEYLEMISKSKNLDLIQKKLVAGLPNHGA